MSRRRARCSKNAGATSLRSNAASIGRSSAEAAQRLPARGESPSALHNNCSGKHAGFLCLACAAGVAPAGYVKRDHPVQREVKAALEAMTGTRLGDGAIDGCAIPTYPVPLVALARGFARFGTGRGLPPVRAAAARRIRGGGQPRIPSSSPATGVSTPWRRRRSARAPSSRPARKASTARPFPSTGLGVAIKCDDGAARAAETAMAAVIARFLPLNESKRSPARGAVEPLIRNWNGETVGRIRMSRALTAGAAADDAGV